MFNSLRKALLACAMVLASSAAFAGPTYLVTLHTQAYSGESGLLDFGMGGNADAPSAFAALWNFSGAFESEFDRSPNTTGDLAGGITIASNRASNYLTQAVNLGGDLSFLVRFTGDFDTVPSDWNNLFAVVLYDAQLTELWAIAVQFDLLSPYNGAPSAVVVTADDALAEVSAVPEPSSLLLMLAALALATLAAGRARRPQ
jgi:hypothetical protein